MGDLPTYHAFSALALQPPTRLKNDPINPEEI